VLNVKRLGGIKTIEKPPSFRKVMAAAGKVRNSILLLSNVSLALGNVPFGFLQMPKMHRAIHHRRRTHSKKLSS
jgi:hypothetical protein